MAFTRARREQEMRVRRIIVSGSVVTVWSLWWWVVIVIIIIVSS